MKSIIILFMFSISPLSFASAKCENQMALVHKYMKDKVISFNNIIKYGKTYRYIKAKVEYAKKAGTKMEVGKLKDAWQDFYGEQIAFWMNKKYLEIEFKKLKTVCPGTDYFDQKK